LQTPFSPVSFGKSFMKIRSAVPENGCLIFCADGKKQKKNKTKHIRICLLPEGGCVNKNNSLHENASEVIRHAGAIQIRLLLLLLLLLLNASKQCAGQRRDNCMYVEPERQCLGLLATHIAAT